MHNAVLHPTPQELTAFALGKLPEHAAASVAAHLDTCPACRQAVAAVPPDSFLDKVRAVKQDSSSFPPDLAEPDDALSSAGKSATPDVPCLNLPPELAHHPKYLILRELGRGGMGVVYQARHKEMDRLVVIKVINRALLDRPDSLERFRREIQAAAQLLHPNIVTAYDAEQAGDSHMLVMEFVPGRSLAEVVRLKGPLPTGIACYFARQIALGLQHAHERNMVHRDIKPLNLMLTPKGQIKILDFGLAKVVSERDTEKGLTETGAYMGTPDYCAPEQAEDARKADIRADLYSLGCTLYYLLAGRPPFQEDTAMKIYLAHREKQPQPLPELRKDVPAELWQVVKRLLAKDPAQRYQKPIEAAQALVPFIKSGAKQVAKGVSPLPQSVESPEKGTRIAADTRQLKLILREVPVKEPPKKVPAKEEASVIEVVEDAPALPKKTTKARESTKRVPAAWYRYRAVLIFAGVAALVVIGAIFIQATWNRWRFAQNQSEGTPQSLDNGQKSDNKVRLPRLKPPINIACQVGHSSEIAFEIERNDCRDQLMLRLEGLPPQVRQESAPAKDTDTLHVKLTIAADLKPQAIPVKLQLHVGDVVADTKALLLNIQKDALLKRPQEEQKPGVRLKDGTPQSLTIEPGKADGLKVLLERGNYAGEAKLHLDGLPAGAMTVPVTVPAGSSSATVTVETKAETQLGEHEAKLRLRVNEQTVDERNITLSVRRPRGRLEIVHFHTVDHMELAGTLYHGWKGKQGMTVLMLHDLGRDCSSPGWKYLAEALQAEGHTVLTFDFRGHGESKKISAAFWKFSVNRYLTSHDAALPAEKQPRTLEAKDLPSTYLPWLIEDIAAARSYLDVRHDEPSDPVNTFNMVVIGAGQASALGSLWLGTEGLRFNAADTSGKTVLKPSEKLSILQAAWLGMADPLKLDPKGIYGWLGGAAAKPAVPITFIYGQDDIDTSSLLEDPIREKYGSPFPIPDARQSGQDLLDSKSKGAEQIKQYLVTTLQKLPPQPWVPRRIKTLHSYWAIPVRLKGEKEQMRIYVAKLVGEETLAPVPFLTLGLRIKGLTEPQPLPSVLEDSSRSQEEANASKKENLPGKKTRVEEEEEPLRRKPKRNIIRPEEKEDPKAKSGTGRPAASDDLAKLAEQATQPAIKALFRSLAVPYDLVLFKRTTIMINGELVRREEKIEPTPYYLGNDPGRFRDQPLRFTPFTLDWKPDTPISPDPLRLECVRPYEEIAQDKVRRFLRESTPAGTSGSPPPLSRYDKLIAAEQVLSSVLRWHEPARLREKRIGDDWKTVEEKLHKQLLDEVRLKQMEMLSKAEDWKRIMALAHRLSITYTQPAERERILRPVADLIQSALRDPTSSEPKKKEVLKHLHELTTEFPDNPVFRTLSETLRDLAQKLLDAARESARNKKEQQAREYLSQAKAICPQLPGLREFESELKKSTGK